LQKFANLEDILKFISDFGSFCQCSWQARVKFLPDAKNLNQSAGNLKMARKFKSFNWKIKLINILDNGTCTSNIVNNILLPKFTGI
jgi:hypothetical protein